MNINEKARKMRELLTKFRLDVDSIYNVFDKGTLELMVKGCNALEGLLVTEMDVITSVYVKSIVRDDLAMVKVNVKTLECAIKLKELHLRDFYLN